HRTSPPSRPARRARPSWASRRRQRGERRGAELRCHSPRARQRERRVGAYHQCPTGPRGSPAFFAALDGAHHGAGVTIVHLRRAPPVLLVLCAAAGTAAAGPRAQARAQALYGDHPIDLSIQAEWLPSGSFQSGAYSTVTAWGVSGWAGYEFHGLELG